MKRYLTEMDEAGVRTVVNLDGGWGDRLKETLAALDEAHPGRFLTFALVNFDGIDEPDWGQREAKRLEESFQTGAKGLKFHKTLGLRYRYKDGRLMTVDDPQARPGLGDVRQAPPAGGDPHRRPGRVLHAAGPLQRALARTEFQPRLAVLRRQQPEPAGPARLSLHRVIAKHPKTTFINTHFGNNAEDLASVADKLDKYPNMYVDIDARISRARPAAVHDPEVLPEISGPDHVRHRHAAAPRGLSHLLPLPGNRRRVLRLLARAITCRGSGTSTASSCPKEVLEKVYRKNAERMLFGLRASGRRSRRLPQKPRRSVSSRRTISS